MAVRLVGNLAVAAVLAVLAVRPMIVVHLAKPL